MRLAVTPCSFAIESNPINNQGQEKDCVIRSSEGHICKQSGSTDENVIKFVLLKPISPRLDMLSPRTIIMLCQTGTNLFLPSFFFPYTRSRTVKSVDLFVCLSELVGGTDHLPLPHSSSSDCL